jgi:hypothetical protein
MSKKTEVISNLTTDQKTALLSHFNSIYECTELTEHEEKMIYLAWMWNQGIVHRNNDRLPEFEEKEAGVPMEDYEITIEDEITGGINLNMMYSYYQLDEIKKIMQW